MKVSERGIELIKRFEGCRLVAYKASISEKFFTIGYGHYGSDVYAGMRITKEQAEEYLINDIGKAESVVSRAAYSMGYDFNQNEFDALVSFAFNVGSINQLTANGTRTKSQIANAMPLYNKCNGKVLIGLIRRRAEEQALFLETCDLSFDLWMQTRNEVKETLLVCCNYLCDIDASYDEMSALCSTLKKCAEILEDANYDYIKEE